MSPSEPHEDPVTALLRKNFEEEVPAELRGRMEGHLKRFRERVREREYAYRPGWRTQGLVLRMAAGLCVALVIMAGLLIALGGSAQPTWADVVKRFAAAPFFNATVYVRENAGADPVQVELWMARGGKSRVRAGNDVIFGEKGRVLESISLTAQPSASPALQGAREMIQHFVERLGALDTFSFETFLQALPQSGVLSPPLENGNAGISNDLVVFDITNPGGPDWIRVWALRLSRLPVRVLFWNPANAESIDAVLSYENEQPPQFFDPAAFKTALAKTAPGTQGNAYLLMKDPAGRPVLPEDYKTKETAGPGPEKS